MVPVVPLLGLWAFNAVALAPALASSSVRRLVDTGPRGRFGNYFAGVAGLTLLQLLALVLGLLALGGSVSTGTGGVRPVVFLFGGSTVGVAALVAVVLGAGFPRLGYWDPTGDGLDGRLALVGAFALYCVAAVVAGFLGLVVAIAVGFPG